MTRKPSSKNSERALPDRLKKSGGTATPELRRNPEKFVGLLAPRADDLVAKLDADQIAHLERLSQRFTEVPAWVQKEMQTANARGWLRLIQVLEKAQADTVIQDSPGARDFLAVMLELASDSIFANNAEQAVDPLDGLLPLGEIGARTRKANQENATRERTTLTTDTGKTTKRALVKDAYLHAGQSPSINDVFGQLEGLLEARGMSPTLEGAKDERYLIAWGEDGNQILFRWRSVQSMLTSIRREVGDKDTQRGRPTKKSKQPR